MEQIHRQADENVDELRYAAVIIGESATDQRHTGILFRVDDTAAIQLLDLAWHRNLRCEKRFSAKYCWVDPKVPTARLRQLAAICDDISHVNIVEGIPYSFGAPVDAFDENTKKFLLGPTKTGLTCASFVLAVFERAQLRLVRYSGWSAPDSDDICWQQSILQKLKETPGVSAEHLDVVEREIATSVRYRPEQVAGAAAIRGRRPVKYRYAKSLGNDIVRFLRGEPDISEFRLSFWDRLLNWLGLS